MTSTLDIAPLSMLISNCFIFSSASFSIAHFSRISDLQSNERI